MQKKWIIKEPDIDAVEALHKALGIDKIICSILANRGIQTAQQAQRFLQAELKDLHDPFTLRDMDKAVERIRRAVAKKENILIFSDYDVDGVTSCAIVEKELTRFGGHVTHYIPHRVKEGYGLNMNAVSLARKRGASLLIALDCGIKNFKEVKALSNHGIDTIIVDHHQPEDNNSLPEAYAIVNPKRRDCPYQFRDLAAVGLVFKLVCALDEASSERYLDLACLGTIADVMPLLDENRIIVKKGLDAINKKSNVGIAALIEASGLKDREVNPGRVSFILAPRINASGRVDSAETSLDLLLATEEAMAQELAGHLNAHNRFRQKIEDEVLKEALNMVERDINFNEHCVIVLAREGWHVGVLGIVAAKIADKFLRPTIIISTNGGTGKGSGRSVAGFHLFEALLGCSQYLEYFGGHSHAVGLTIAPARIADFAKDLNTIAKDRLIFDQLRPTVTIDAQLPLVFLKEGLIAHLQELAPFGQGNPEPVFCTHNVTIKSTATVLGRETIKFWVSDGERTCEAIGFGMKDFARYIVPSRKAHIAYTVTVDSWQDINSLLLEVKDLQFVD